MKSLKFILSQPFTNVYDNNVDALIPELWANESLAILEENMIATQLVHRDFEDELANYGDVVNTRRPGEFEAKRKGVNDDVTIQAANATNVQVTLNQHVHVSFLIRDGEESMAFKDLAEIYMAPAMLAQARFLDRVVLGQYPQFLVNAFGGLGTTSTSNARDRLLGVREIMNRNKAYMDNRQLILSPATETNLLKLDAFVQAQQVGDTGLALQEAWLGRKYGFNMYMCQNMAEVRPTSGVVTGAINNSGGYAAGTTSITVDGLSAAITVGTWLSVAGDDSPQQVVSTTGGSTPTAIVLYPGLRAAVANDAVITLINKDATTTSYAAGWSKEIGYTGSVVPQVGQMVSFGTDQGVSSNVYTIVDIDTTSSPTTILLDRPLVALVGNGAAINFGPPGAYNLAFHRNAIALVVRPLSRPKAGAGALSSVVSHHGLSMRATITYEGRSQGHLITLDMLCGVAVLDPNLGAVFVG